MVAKIGIIVFACIQFVTCMATSAEEWRYEKYFVDKDKSERWKIPTQDEAVDGRQNFWFVTPHDIRKGGIMVGVYVPKVTDFSVENGFTFTPESVWGAFTYKVTPLKKVSTEKVPPINWPTVGSEWITWSTIPDMKKSIILNGMVTRVLPEGKGFEVDLKFKDGLFPVRFDVVSEKLKPKEKYPDVFSRQYGPHWLQSFDVYYPKGYKPGIDKPLPAIINIHGGGWSAFNKHSNSAQWTDEGIAYVSIGYRYLGMYKEKPEMTMRIAAPLLDAARALQYIRYNAKELGLDPDRFCLTGGSAGGASSSWLAMVDDLAEPQSEDPISRMSTRVACSIPVQAQTSLDPIQMRSWIPQVNYGHHAFFDSEIDKVYKKIKTNEEKFQYFLDNRDKVIEAIEDFSAYGFATKDDPPMLLCYDGQKDLIPSPNDGNATHHPKFGEYLQKRLRELGVECWYWCADVREKDKGGEYIGWKGDIKFFKDQLMKNTDAK